MQIDLAHSFYKLDPQRVLEIVEAVGLLPTGEFTQLNSYENRVFDIKLENAEPLIAKFYRPQRWTREQILEEHDFLIQLQAEGIPAIAPLIQKNHKTLSEHDGIFVALFPKVRGRLPQEFLNDDLEKVGRLLAQIHNLGAQKRAVHRPKMDRNFAGGRAALQLLTPVLAPEIRHRYLDAAETILEAFENQLEPNEFIRIHGDCHRGNLLNNGKQFFIVDFDDFCMGPVVQDFWMLMTGDEETKDLEKDKMLDGYEELRDFPHHQWSWIPILRGIRILSYAAWIARRWQDPSFPKIFPEYGTYKYWAEETEALEKIAWGL